MGGTLQAITGIVSLCQKITCIGLLYLGAHSTVAPGAQEMVAVATNAAIHPWLVVVHPVCKQTICVVPSDCSNIQSGMGHVAPQNVVPFLLMFNQC